MNRAPVPLAKAYLLINHGPVVLVSSAHGDARNVMAAAWAMALDFAPPKVAVVVDKSTFTRTLIEASGEFVLNVPARGMVEKVLAVGSQSGRGGGRERDKFTALGIHTEAAERVAAPLVEGCVAWLECKVIPEPHNEKAYDLFIGEVVAAWADPEVFSEGRWHMGEGDQRTLHYAAGGQFFATGEVINVGSAS